MGVASSFVPMSTASRRCGGAGRVTRSPRTKPALQTSHHPSPRSGRSGAGRPCLAKSGRSSFHSPVGLPEGAAVVYWHNVRKASSTWTLRGGSDDSDDEPDGELLRREARGVSTPQVPGKGGDTVDQALIDALKAEGVEGAPLLDIGGGIGAIQHELLAAAPRTPQASTPRPRISKRHGRRAAAVASAIASRTGTATLSSWPTRSHPPTCHARPRHQCVSGLERLLGLSAARAQRFYGLVYRATPL